MNEVAKSERPKALNAVSTRGAALLGGAGTIALVLGGLTVALAPSASADGIEQPKGNPTCADLIPGSKELKIDNPTVGLNTDADGGLTVNATVRTLLVDDPAHPGDQTGNQVFDFVALGGAVLGVIVKGGESSNFYDYRPAGVTAGTSLHAPLNPKNEKFSGLSHMSFCFGKPTTPTPTPTPTPTVSETPSTSPTPTPTPTVSETATTSPTPTPTSTASETPTMSPSVTPSSSPSESAPVVVPTSVDAGLSGPQSTNKSAITSTQGIWGGVLLAIGGILLAAGILKTRQRRGHHAA